MKSKVKRSKQTAPSADTSRVLQAGSGRTPRKRNDITERQRVEEALLASEERYRVLVETLPDGVVVHSQGRVVFANSASATLIGAASPAELVGKPVIQFVHPDYRLLALERIQRSLGEGVPAEIVEERFLRLDGTPIDVQVSASPFFYSGEPAMMTVFRNITERKRAEEELKASEKKYRELYDFLPIPVYEMDLEANITAANRAIFETFRGTENDFKKGFNAWKLLSPEDVKRSADNIQRLLKGEKVEGTEYNFARLDGSVFPAIVISSVIYGHDRPTGLRGAIIDITERKGAEEALRRERELYLDLVNTQPAGVYRLRVLSNKVMSEDGWISSKDAPYFFELISDRFCEILKLDRQAFDDNPGIINDLVFDADKAGFARKNIEANLRMIPFMWEGRLVVAGAPLWVHLESRPRPLEDGDTIWTGILYDIAERKQAEEAVQASLREKEILLREIHHRVKNNMQIISSLFNLQSGHIQDENARRMLKEGQLRIRSMALVHEKLYQSRDLSNIDFADYLQSLSAHLFQFFRVKPDRIRLETDLKDAHLDINSAVPCGLLVTELITNALKHAFPADRKGVVKIGLLRREDGFVELRVADDGVGFPEGLDFRCAESFGLQIVSLLVGQIEGTIELARENGTAFTVVFREPERRART
jgi:PAS domain S-box-containing protein